MASHGGVQPDAEADYAQRYDTADQLVHDFRKVELADPALHFLVPWCERGKLLPRQISRLKIDRQPLSSGSKLPLCPDCVHERQASRQGWPS